MRQKGKFCFLSLARWRDKLGECWILFTFYALFSTKYCVLRSNIPVKIKAVEDSILTHRCHGFAFALKCRWLCTGKPTAYQWKAAGISMESHCLCTAMPNGLNYAFVDYCRLVLTIVAYPCTPICILACFSALSCHSAFKSDKCRICSSERVKCVWAALKTPLKKKFQVKTKKIPNLFVCFK